jgi:uncharacterized protein (DUF342 family)
MSTTETTQNTFRIEIAADKMSAVLIVDSGASVSVHDVFARIKKLGIRGFDDGAIIEALESRDKDPLRIEFVRGEPAVGATPPRLDYLVPVATGANGAFSLVESGQDLAHITPGQPGRDGYDVFRNVVRAPQPTFEGAGSGVMVEGDRLKATCSGSFRVKDGQARVGPVRELDAHSITRGSPAVFEGDLLVKGSLKPRQRLQVSGGVVIEGGIDGASLRSGEWAHIREAMEGSDKSRVIVGGDLYAAGIGSMRVNAMGDVVLSGDLRDSHVFCVGAVNATGHAVRGGETIANGGVICDTLGTPDGTPTVVEVGVDEPLRLTLADTRPIIDAYRQQIARAQTSLRSIQGAQTMTAQQRDRANGVLAEVNDVRQLAQEQVATLADRCAQASRRQACEVRVHLTLHAGVTIRFPSAQTTITQDWKGPLTIKTDPADAGAIVIELPDGTRTPLPATPRDGNYRNDMQRVLSLTAAA